MLFAICGITGNPIADNISVPVRGRPCFLDHLKTCVIADLWENLKASHTNETIKTNNKVSDKQELEVVKVGSDPFDVLVLARLTFLSGFWDRSLVCFLFSLNRNICGKLKLNQQKKLSQESIPAPAGSFVHRRT